MLLINFLSSSLHTVLPKRNLLVTPVTVEKAFDSHEILFCSISLQQIWQTAITLFTKATQKAGKIYSKIFLSNRHSPLESMSPFHLTNLFLFFMLPHSRWPIA